MGRTLPYCFLIILCFWKFDCYSLEKEPLTRTLFFQDVPSCTNLVVPINGQNDVPVETDLSWNVIPEARGYRITVGRTPGGGEILDNFDVGDMTTFDFDVNFNPGETIYVTITPYNDAGSASNCPEESFTLRTTQVGIPVCSLMRTPEHLSFGAPSDTDVYWYAVSGATGYRLTVATTPNGNDVVDDLDLGGSLSYDFPQDFAPGTLVYVKVSPYNQAGTAFGCSRQNFRVAYTERPQCAELTTNLLNNQDVSISTDLTWETVDRAVGYRLSVGTSPNNSDIVDDLLIEGESSYSLSENLPTNTTIYVSLTSYNSLGNALGCTQQEFRTQQLLPQCSFLIEPDIEKEIIDVNTELSWQASENAEGYRISIVTIPSGVNETFDRDVGNTTRYVFNEDFENGDSVYVTITAYNRTGDAIGCNEESFSVSTDNLVPKCDSYISALDSAQEVPITTELYWYENQKADGYIVSAGTAPNTRNILNKVDLGNLTSYALSEFLPYNQSVFVTVTPYNRYGNGQDCNFVFSTVPRILNRTTSVNGFSPNGDGLNDFWIIEGIEAYPQNAVVIYNRWGNRVFEIKNYNNVDKVFWGEANVMTNLGAGKLPSGTYFFEIATLNKNDLAQTRGSLILKR